MYLITFDPESRRVLSCGAVSAPYMLDILPEGAAYTTDAPKTPVTDYLYTESGEYVKAEVTHDDVSD